MEKAKAKIAEARDAIETLRAQRDEAIRQREETEQERDFCAGQLDERRTQIEACTVDVVESRQHVARLQSARRHRWLSLGLGFLAGGLSALTVGCVMSDCPDTVAVGAGVGAGMSGGGAVILAW